MRLICIVILFCFYACSSDLPDKREMSKVLYDKKVQDLYKDIDGKCRFEAFKNAELHVDRLVDKWINSSIHDTIDFPPKPLKPIAPDPILGTVKRFDLDSIQ